MQHVSPPLSFVTKTPNILPQNMQQIIFTVYLVAGALASSLLQQQQIYAEGPACRKFQKMYI